jgi:ATP-dependent exoDNAse (exonuclease V) beta subunit
METENQAFSEWKKTLPLTTHEDKLTLAEEYQHPKDECIFFDEIPHKYYVFDKTTSRPLNNLISITTLIHKYTNHFDADAVIRQNIGNWSTKPSSKYYNMTAEQIKKLWADENADASPHGTKMHRWIELFYNGINVPETKDNIEFQYFLKFHQDEVVKKGWISYRTEWRIWDARLGIVGTIDKIFIANLEKPMEIIIYDWKRSKEIKKSSFKNQKMHDPVSYLADCNFMHYSLQLNLYKYLLETNYDFKVVGMFLGIFHPINQSYIIEEISPKYGYCVEEILGERIKELVPS